MFTLTQLVKKPMFLPNEPHLSLTDAIATFVVYILQEYNCSNTSLGFHLAQS